MALSAYDLQKIGSAGAGFSVDAKKFTPYDLRKIAEGVAQGGGQLIVKNAGGLGSYDLQKIAESGKGHIFIELDENK